MSESRRGAVRLTHGEPGQLEFYGRSVDCVVEDMSLAGARVKLVKPGPIPDRVTLDTTLGGERILIPGNVRRGEPGHLIAIEFDDGDASGLARLIAAEQRTAIQDGRRAAVERRRERRPPPRPR